jgi:hypothetical protein
MHQRVSGARPVVARANRVLNAIRIIARVVGLCPVAGRVLPWCNSCDTENVPLQDDVVPC